MLNVCACLTGSFVPPSTPVEFFHHTCLQLYVQKNLETMKLHQIPFHVRTISANKSHLVFESPLLGFVIFEILVPDISTLETYHLWYIEGKREEAQAERELAARNREDAMRARNATSTENSWDWSGANTFTGASWGKDRRGKAERNIHHLCDQLLVNGRQRGDVKRACEREERRIIEISLNLERYK